MRTVEAGNLIRHVPLAGTVTYDAPALDSLGPAADVAADETPLTIGVSTDTPDVIQQAAHPTYMVVMEGAAMRLAFQINAPQLLSYGGVQLGPLAERILIPRCR